MNIKKHQNFHYTLLLAIVDYNEIPSYNLVVSCNILIYLKYFYTQRKGIFKKSRGNKYICIEFTTPEVKLLLIFLYFTLVLCVYWADFSTSLRNRNKLLTAIYDYIFCVNNPNNQGVNCEELREDIYDASVPALRAIAILMSSAVNFGNVVFVLQFKDVKKRIRSLKRRLTAKSDHGGDNRGNTRGDTYGDNCDALNTSKQ